MYHGKRLDNSQRQKSGMRKSVATVLSLLIILTVSVGGTLAYLITHTDPVRNQFTPSYVACQVTEDFDGKTKSNVNVTNTGDTEAYIRVKLVTYRVNDKGDHIGGTAEIPGFKPGTNWVKYYDGYYYYTKPVAPGKSPATELIDESGITLSGTYADADGGKQVIEVMAEAIQSGPAEAVGNSWGVSISEGRVTAYNS